ncbi:dendritic arbor reduction protein 1 [Fagus crenata]
MRSRCSKQESKERMQLDKLSKLKEEPHLSGAYIRSLVKQLTSSRTKDPIMNPKDSDCSTSVVDGDGDAFPAQNLTRFSETTQQAVQQSPQPQQHKKQVRRRLHTSRPYQERLLNMAEARREIVTALKFHRAAMKQQESEQQLQQTQQQQSLPVLQPQPVLHPCFEQEAARFKYRRNPRIYPSATTPNFSNYLDNLSYPSFSHPPGSSSYPFSSPLFAPPPPVAENLNFTLPNQPLGLNLNFHDFNNLDTNLYHNNNNSPFVSSSSSPSTSSSSSHTLSIATDQEVPNSVGTPALALADVIKSSGAAGGTVSGDLHAAMDDEEMAEIRSIGEQHQMEWNDTMNLVTSAWWFKFLKNMEIEDPDVKAEADDDGYRPFDEVMEFPSWLNANDNCLQQHFNDYCSEDYYQYPALPW